MSNESERKNPIGRAWTFFVPEEASLGAVILRAIGDTGPVSSLVLIGQEISKGNSPAGLALSILTLPVTLGISLFMRKLVINEGINHGQEN